MNVFEDFIKRISSTEFAKYIDHTILKPEATIEDVMRGVDYTRRYGFACLVASPYHALRILDEVKDIRICSVVGFPLGYNSTSTKIEEAKKLIEKGIAEIDMVMNIQAFKEKNYDYVLSEISKITEIAHRESVVVKVIIETGLLSDEEKVKATELVMEGGADYVKTCTGFLGGKATVHDVILLRNASKGKVKVKASGGIRRLYDAIALIMAGADRLGTSSGVIVMEEFLRIKKSLG